MTREVGKNQYERGLLDPEVEQRGASARPLTPDAFTQKVGAAHVLVTGRVRWGQGDTRGGGWYLKEDHPDRGPLFPHVPGVSVSLL